MLCNRLQDTAQDASLIIKRTGTTYEVHAYDSQNVWLWACKVEPCLLLSALTGHRVTFLDAVD